MLRTAAVAVALIISALSSRDGLAQNLRTRAEGDALQRFGRLQKQVNGHDRVRARVHTQWVEMVRPQLSPEGVVGFVPASSGTLRQDADSDHVRLSDVSEIQVRQWATGKGAAIGAGIGGVLGMVGGAIGGVALANWDGPLGVGSGPGRPDPSGGEQLMFGVMGGGLGAVVGIAAGGFVGAAIGAPFKRWKTIYRADAAGRREELGLAVSF